MRRSLLLPAALLMALMSLSCASVAMGAEGLEPSPHELNPHNPHLNKEFNPIDGTPSGPYEDACGVSVPVEAHRENISGEYEPLDFLYAADYYHDRVDVYWPYGGYISPLGTRDSEITISEVEPRNGPCGLAVDTWGDVFVNTWREKVLMYTPKYMPNVENPAPGEEYTRTVLHNGTGDTGVAVDQYYNKYEVCCEYFAVEEHQDVFVDTGKAIIQYELPESGREQIPRTVNYVQTIGEDPNAEYFGVAVSTYPSTKGYIYVADAATNTIKVFDPSFNTEEPIEELDGAGTPQHGFKSLEESTVAVDNQPESPSFGHIYVVDTLQPHASEHPEVALDEFNPRGGYRGQISHWIAEEGEPPVPTEHWLTASEPTGVTFDEYGDVLVTSGNDEGSEEKNRNNVGSVVWMFEPMKLSKPIIVEKTGSGGGKVVSAPAGINCGTACEAEYTKEAGEVVTLTATPDAHSAFVGWSGGCTGADPVCQVVIEKGPVEIEAEFEALPQKSLTVTVGGSGQGVVTTEPSGIDCPSGSTCSEGFNEGSTVSLVATPAPHNRFVEWLGPDCDESTQPTCPISMTAAKAVEARFAPIPQKTLQVDVSGSGTVQSEPGGISCPSACAHGYDEEGTITLVAAPAEHQELAQWTGCTTQPSQNECIVAMKGQERTVGAQFSPIRRRVAVTVVGAGSVSADHGAISGCTGAGGTCSAFYLDGEIVRLSAAAAPGYQFAGWSGGVCGGTGTCEVRLEANASIVANFAALPVIAPPAIERARIHLRKAAVNGSSATLTLSVTGPGAVNVAGKRLSRAHARAKSAGVVTLQVKLTKAGTRALERAGRHGLRVSVTIIFVPANGTKRSVIEHVITFRGSSRHGAHRHHRKRH